MDNQTSIEKRTGYLVMKMSGPRNNFLSIVADAKLISNAINENNIKYILTDFREINFNVSESDALNLVKFYEQKLPGFDDLTASLVISKGNLEIVKFWESVCHQRGYRFKIFTDYDEAEQWLINNMP